jgi:methylphosphotriester-DNA--protein-cysteine methyltransferase
VFILDEGAIRYDLEARHRGAAGRRVTILPPHVVHDGRAATGEGFRKRVLYVDTEVLDGRFVGRAVDDPDVDDPHLVQCFSKTYGIAPHRYVLGRRIDAARRRLLDGEPIAQVATGVGFHDQAHLTRHFRRHVGTTPARFTSTTRA